MSETLPTPEKNAIAASSEPESNNTQKDCNHFHQSDNKVKSRFEHVFSLFEVLLLIATLVFSIISFNIQNSIDKNLIDYNERVFELSRVSKRAEITNSFQNRYSDLIWNVKKSVGKDSILEDEYYQRYWHLQLEQYQYFIRGFIDIEIFKSWMDYRRL